VHYVAYLICIAYPLDVISTVIYCGRFVHPRAQQPALQSSNEQNPCVW